MCKVIPKEIKDHEGVGMGESFKSNLKKMKLKSSEIGARELQSQGLTQDQVAEAMAETIAGTVTHQYKTLKKVSNEIQNSK